MRVTTLVDNVVYGQGLFAEHGLSFFIETGNRNILFDTGQSGDVLVKNAAKLGVDLSSVNYLFLSHGHYDHTGGLAAFLEINHDAMVIYGRGAMDNKYSKSTGKIREIGCPWKDKLSDYHNKFIEITDNRDIVPGIKIIKDFHSKNDFEKPSPSLLLKHGNTYITDDFHDEIALLIKEGTAYYLVTGCSHNGIVNIIKSASNEVKISGVFGGSHLSTASESRIQKTAFALKQSGIAYIGVNHCTGVEAYAAMKAIIGSGIRYLSVGSVVNSDNI